MFIVMQLANRQNIIRKWGNGQPYGQVPPFVFRRKENTFAKSRGIPAVACREAYDSLYTIEGRGDAHISK